MAMWVEEITLDNIKLFAKTTPLRFVRRKGEPYRWVTLLGENGGGKSTVLQALALALAGPESAQKLCPSPVAWLHDEARAGRIGVRIHQDEGDSGRHGQEKVARAFGYSLHVTGSKPLTVNNRRYSEPAVVERGGDKRLGWLRSNAFAPDSLGWFAAGYGPFRRLTREVRTFLPSAGERPARFENFLTQFNEDEPLSTFEEWFFYLDYQTHKDREDEDARRRMELAKQAVNALLPEGTEYAGVTSEGRICFSTCGQTVPTSSMSDGYRSILALAGDLVFRLLAAFPDSETPLLEKGVVLIDELDIHLHPVWQRDIAGCLRRWFPGLQFIVATHSPFIAAGAGEDARTLRLTAHDGGVRVEPVENLHVRDVRDILRSRAFGLVSTYSPETQDKLDRYDYLGEKGSGRTEAESREHKQLSLFLHEARPFGGPPPKGSLEARIDDYLAKTFR
jgi:hypothetical protein